jgi:hypothetical protein
MKAQDDTRDDAQHDSYDPRDEFDGIKPSTEGVIRIWDDARKYLNVGKGRDIQMSGRVPEDAILRQLQAEGYTEDDAEDIVEHFGKTGDLDRSVDGVVPVVLNIDVTETEVTA